MSVIYGGTALIDDDESSDSIAKSLLIEEIQEKLDEVSPCLERVGRLIVRLQPCIEEVNESARVIREAFDFYYDIAKLMTKFTTDCEIKGVGTTWGM